MNKRVAWAMVLTFTAMLSARSWGADITVTVYADQGYPPYSYAQDGQPTGIYHAIVKVAFSRMEGYRIDIKVVPWKRGTKLLEERQGFVLYPS